MLGRSKPCDSRAFNLRMVSSPPKDNAQSPYNKRINRPFDPQPCILISDEAQGPMVAGQHTQAALLGRGPLVDKDPRVLYAATRKGAEPEHQEWPRRLDRIPLKNGHAPTVSGRVSAHMSSAAPKRTSVLPTSPLTLGEMSVVKGQYTREKSLRGVSVPMPAIAMNQDFRGSSPEIDEDSRKRSPNGLIYRDAGLPRKQRKTSNPESSAEAKAGSTDRQRIVGCEVIMPQNHASSSASKNNLLPLRNKAGNKSSVAIDTSLYSLTRSKDIGISAPGIYARPFHQSVAHLGIANSRRRYNQFEGTLCIRVLWPCLPNQSPYKGTSAL